MEKVNPGLRFAKPYYQQQFLVVIGCNGPVRGCSLGLQADVDTSSRIGDDDALSSS